MRNNQPVTGQEYVIRDDAAFITHTDAKGRITRANDEFVEASGFSREELLGQPHNIVRHPDMPAEAFRDLWTTLKRGRPWTGLVKNRRKNGDHYWVRANVSPTADGGYTSVRAKPSRQEVAAAEALYARMRADPGVKLQGGFLVPSGFAGWNERIFGRLLLSHRFWLMTALSATMFVLATLIGWLGLGKTQDTLKLVIEGPVKQLEFLGHIKSDLLSNQADILKGFQHDPQGTMVAVHDHPLSLHLDAVAKRTTEVAEQWRQYMATYMPEEEKKLADAFDGRMKAWFDKQQGAVAKLTAGDYSGAAMAAFLKAGREEGNAALEAADKLIHFQEDEVNGEYDAAQANYQQDKLLFLILTLTGLAGVFGSGWAIVARLSRELRHAGETADAIATGDLTRLMPRAGEDEIGELIAKLALMRNTLHELIASISQNMRALAGSATELSGSAAGSAHTTEMQAEAASSMAASVEELSVSIDQVGEHATEANTVSRESAEASLAGGGVVHETAGEIGRIAEAVNSSAGTIRELEGYSVEISSIVDVIKEIAEQTNLLALNAAIEAARAGEAGRGFAVVADEVRKLAERTANSTHQITAMISKVQQGARQAVADMEAGVTRVTEGVRMAHEAGDSVADIRHKSERVMRAVDDINLALKEQSVAAREIARNVERVAQMTERGSEASRKVAGVAKEVAGLTDEIRRLADLFRI